MSPATSGINQYLAALREAVQAVAIRDVVVRGCIARKASLGAVLSILPAATPTSEMSSSSRPREEGRRLVGLGSLRHDDRSASPLGGVDVSGGTGFLAMGSGPFGSVPSFERSYEVSLFASKYPGHGL